MSSWVERSRGKRRLKWVLVVIIVALAGGQFAMRLARWQRGDSRCVRVALDPACKAYRRPGGAEIEIAPDHGDICRLRGRGPWTHLRVQYGSTFDKIVHGDSGQQVWVPSQCVLEPQR